MRGINWSKENTVVLKKKYVIVNCKIVTLGLTDFETYHMIPNINFSNKFYFDNDNKKITIPEGSSELHAINDYLKCAILQDERVSKDIENDDEEYPIVLHANHSTLKAKSNAPTE